MPQHVIGKKEKQKLISSVVKVKQQNMPKRSVL